jgi:two-component system response regulator PilR (NtrC family)
MVRKVGSTKEDPVDVRIISATHRNLTHMLETGQFRQDLYYRLNVIELKMPALREMAQDIPALASRVLEKQAGQLGVTIPRLDGNAVAALVRHPFPGNVRELENILERALALCDGRVIIAEDLCLDSIATSAANESIAPGELPLPEYLENLEKRAILEALQKTGHNRTAAAKLLGVSFRALRYRLAKLGLGKAD